MNTQPTECGAPPLRWGNRQGRTEGADRRPGRRWRSGGGAILISLLLIAAGPAQTIEGLRQQRIAWYEAVAQAGRRSEAGDAALDAGSAGTAGQGSFDPSRQYFFVPSDLAGLPDGDSPGDDPASRVTPLDRLRAASLFEMARQALGEDAGQLAFQLAHEVLQFDPGHAEARRWLDLPATGSARDRWEIRPARRPHPRYAWPASGYRIVSTPHFQITTDDREATALALAQTLEELHAVWRQLFFDLWSHPAVLRARAAGQPSHRRRQARHRVVMFREREAYVRFIRQIEPQAELTRGYYHAPSRTAYFVGGEAPLAATWRHEVTHQLFHENVPTARQIGGQHNFWIVEGVALYLESLQRCRQWRTVGGHEAARLQYARFRALREGFYLPLASLTALDQTALQRDERIRQIYSQAAGLTHFFMDGQQGKYRTGLIDYLALVYRGRDRHDSLLQATRRDWSELDQEYRDYLDLEDQQLRRLDRDVRIEELCLGGTSITEDGFMNLPALDHVSWLDAYGTPLTDRATEALAHAPRLARLSLERTGVGDATVARLGAATGLKHLDLSGTRISDAALESIGRLSHLESLWLTNTAISDEGLRHLFHLQQLRILDLDGTPTTAAGRAALRSALPQLSAE